MHHERNLFCRMDISQDFVDVAVQLGTAFQIANNEQGLAETVKRLQTLTPALIVLAATGGLEVPLAGHWPRSSRVIGS
ncbi:MAG TPA: hypothetical protein VN666_02940 [Nitrospira sp.]|nr:hypothetical protein [Nitrospira sp.]